MLEIVIFRLNWQFICMNFFVQYSLFKVHYLQVNLSIYEICTLHFDFFFYEHTFYIVCCIIICIIYFLISVCYCGIIHSDKPATFYTIFCVFSRGIYCIACIIF